MRVTLRSVDYNLTETNPVAVYEIDNGPGGYSPHGHEFTEIAVVLSGEGRHRLDGLAVNLRKGDCFVVAPGRVHSYEALRDFRVLNVLFLESAVRARIPEVAGLCGYRGLLQWEPASRGRFYAGAPVRPEAEKFEFIVRLIRYIAQVQEASPQERNPKSILALGLVIAELCRAFVVADVSNVGRFTSLERAILWLENHYGERFSLADFAGAAALSTATLNRRFREIMGCSPMEYVRKERLRRAALALRETTLKVPAIAKASGFSDAPHLERSFKKEYGRGTREYRRGFKPL